jgi:putative lipoic acid-binding regulatory protein
MTDSEVKAPKIEFPCADYPIKIIGDTGVGFKDKVIEIVEKHATVDMKSLASTPPFSCTSLPPVKISSMTSTANCAPPASSIWCCDGRGSGLS